MVFDEDGLRALIADEVRRVIREELARTPGRDEYLSVDAAARIAGVRPGTIRDWISDRRLPGFHAGRRLRVRRGDLEAFLASSPTREAPDEWAVRVLRGGRSR